MSMVVIVLIGAAAASVFLVWLLAIRPELRRQTLLNSIRQGDYITWMGIGGVIKTGKVDRLAETGLFVRVRVDSGAEEWVPIHRLMYHGRLTEKRPL